jgi:hypothetical protein
MDFSLGSAFLPAFRDEIVAGMPPGARHPHGLRRSDSL